MSVCLSVCDTALPGSRRFEHLDLIPAADLRPLYLGILLGRHRVCVYVQLPAVVHC
jgi:hypothetical protein